MSSIIDNRDSNTLLNNLHGMAHAGRDISIATAFFSLDALLLMADELAGYERVRILFGDDANATQRRRLLEMLRRTSDEELLPTRETQPSLSPLRKIESLFAAGRVEARCYTAKKFHAKAYLIHRPANSPPMLAVLGSGNFTRWGLTQNIELNVKLYEEQTSQLQAWFEERWEEAAADVVTENVLAEIRRQIDLYEPYVLYLKALSLWGARQIENGVLGRRTALQDALDPHQEQGFLRALTILKREHGVMVCDGVGLGKSFIALALMEQLCRDGRNVLLVAPKNILTSAWEGYLKSYLSEFRKPFGSIHEIAMTELGFDPAATGPSAVEKRDSVQRLFERADVVIIDESHNFRSTSADRYKNLHKIVEAFRGRRKDVVLLTATPINTSYRDISNQLSLVTQEKGSIGGYTNDQIRRFAAELDRARPDVATSDQASRLTMEPLDTPSTGLNNVLQSIVIQRSRATCKALAEAKGKSVHFPIRRDPEVVDVVIGEASPAYRQLIALAQRRFQPGVEFIKQMRVEIAKADKSGKQVAPVAYRKGPPKGIKLAAFLTEQYRLAPEESSSRRIYQDEVHLAGLVFANTLKQMESSGAAFQGIVQSLGIGLIARLKHVFPNEASDIIAQHESWIRTPLFSDGESAPPADVDSDDDIEEDGETLDAGGEESDAWLTQAVRARRLEKKLAGFHAGAFDTERWKADIVADLAFLHEIHAATIAARRQPDPKMDCVLPVIEQILAEDMRALVFTQSQRTAEYLERELKKRLPGKNVARIDSRIEKTRAAILHAFCPGYNQAVHAPSVPAKLDVLISTDVLSEGVNLQEAGAIVNWDIHWNPVRLIQRIGRVDRRLNPEITPASHSFRIINVLPADEINQILNLVGAVENRTLKISNALGLDVSFFKSTDPAGNLKEFNSLYDGEMTGADRALAVYERLNSDASAPRMQNILEAIPAGAFGVWGGAPRDGVFALFTMEPTARATDTDRERFASVLGQPVLVLDQFDRAPITDPASILDILSATVPGVPSAMPSSDSVLAGRLATLKEAARRQFGEIGLPSTILPKLICWMELRQTQ